VAAAKDSSWIAKVVHPNLSYRERDTPAPQDQASLALWDRYNNANFAVLNQELFPISITITGNIAVVQYRYLTPPANHEKEHEMVTGRWTDVLVKDGGRWSFTAWADGDDPEK